MACRYTVREIGLADFAKDSYQFILFKDNRISDSDVKLFKNISQAALHNANISTRVIDVQKNEFSPLLEFYKMASDGIFPNLLFVSPQGSAKAFRFNQSKDLTQAIWYIIEKIVTSPARAKLMENIIKSFAVIYFIEGTNSEENIKAREIVESAISVFKPLMLSLPKAVHTPPAIITIKANETGDEDVLLWSLGWEEVDKSKPSVALIYGRGRRMGPMLNNNYIREDIIRNMLRFIGEDCECGLDRNWMLGTMIPLRWDSKLKSAVLAQYGFDADNPLVISEMSQILSVAPARINRSVDTGILYGYSESIMKLSEPANKLPGNESEMINDNSFNESIRSITVSLIGLSGLTLIGGFIILRRRKRNS
jgi:hypothetical protein